VILVKEIFRIVFKDAAKIFLESFRKPHATKCFITDDTNKLSLIVPAKNLGLWQVFSALELEVAKLLQTS